MNNIITRNIYYRLPTFTQNILFSLYGFKLYRSRYNKFFHEYLRELRESEWWLAEHIRDYQNKKLRQLVHHAYHTIPFYKKWFAENDVRPENIRTMEDLSKLPILTKQMVKRNQTDLISRNCKKSNLIKVTTSGTTGTPLGIYKTEEALAFQWAIWWRHKARFGLHLRDKHIMFGARLPIPVDHNKSPFWRYDYFNKRIYLSACHITEKNLPAIMNYLNSNDFDFYTGNPNALYILSKLMINNDIKLLRRPKYVVTGASALLPSFEKAIRNTIGVTITEQYGMAEFAGNMSKCEYGKFHLDFECGIVEEKPIHGVEGYSSLIFTGWGNPAMPFIRYEVGDYGHRSSEQCSCGRYSICFDSIDGRTDDYIRTPDGRMVIGLSLVIKGAPGVKEMQIVQEKYDEIQLLIVPGKTYSNNDELLLKRELRRRIGEEMKIKFVYVDHIQKSTPGKFRAVVSKLPGGTIDKCNV